MKKALLGETPDGILIYEVSGARTRQDMDIEFALGANWLAKNYIPKNEVWVEKLPDPVDQCFNIGHELYEARKMRDEGTSYDTAHKSASKHEARLRKTGSCRLVWGES